MIYARFTAGRSRQGYENGNVYRIRLHKNYVLGADGQPPYDAGDTETFLNEWEVIVSDPQEEEAPRMDQLEFFNPDQEL